jgi:hypothetical protein
MSSGEAAAPSKFAGIVHVEVRSLASTDNNRQEVIHD